MFQNVPYDESTRFNLQFMYDEDNADSDQIWSNVSGLFVASLLSDYTIIAQMNPLDLILMSDVNRVSVNAWIDGIRCQIVLERLN